MSCQREGTRTQGARLAGRWTIPVDVLLLLLLPPASTAEAGDPGGAPTWLGMLSAARTAAEPPDRQRGGLWEKEYRTLFPAYVDEGLARWLDVEYFLAAHVQVDYAATLHCDAGASSQRGDIGITQHDFGVRVSPHSFPAVPYTPTFKLRQMQIRGDARLPDTGQPLPENLWDFRVSQTSVVLPIPLGFVDVTLGSASDKPFDSADEFTADITWFMGGLGWDRCLPIVLVNWANNRDYLNRGVVPGGGFRWRDEECRYRLMLGFPYNAAYWEPVKGLRLLASYQFPRTVHANVEWTIAGPLKAVGGFDWTSQRYLLHDRRRRDDRLWYLEKRLYAGLRWEFASNVYLEAIGGYAFDRFFFEAEDYEHRSFNRIDVSDGPFLMLQFSLRF